MPNNDTGRRRRDVTVGVLRSASHARIGLTDALARAVAEESWSHIKVGSDIVAADVAILVVSAVDGPLPDGRTELRLARDADVPLVVALTEVDKIADPELLDLVELEVREFVKDCGYRSHVPVVHLSLEGPHGSRRARPGVLRLVESLEEHVSVRP